MKKTIWEKLANEPIMHDHDRKEMAFRYIHSNPHATAQQVADKFLLEKRVVREFDNGIRKVEYYTGSEIVMELHEV